MDSSHTSYCNGVLLGSASSWTTPDTWTCDAVDGSFVIGINADGDGDGEVNRSGSAALMATINANNGERMISDSSWKCIVLEGDPW